MSKICPDCKTENTDNAGFCQNCGKKLNEITNTKKPEEKPGALSSWWNKQSKGGKVRINSWRLCTWAFIYYCNCWNVYSRYFYFSI